MTEESELKTGIEKQMVSSLSPFVANLCASLVSLSIACSFMGLNFSTPINMYWIAKAEAFKASIAEQPSQEIIDLMIQQSEILDKIMIRLDKLESLSHEPGEN